MTEIRIITWTRYGNRYVLQLIDDATGVIWYAQKYRTRAGVVRVVRDMLNLAPGEPLVYGQGRNGVHYISPLSIYALESGR